MKKSYCMIIKNSLTGEQVKIPNADELTVKGKEAVIEAYTERFLNECIGYYISFMYEY